MVSLQTENLKGATRLIEFGKLKAFEKKIEKNQLYKFTFN